MIESLRDRILGASRPTTCCIPRRRPSWSAGSMLDEDAVDELETAGIDEVKVRTAADLRHALRPVRQVLRPRPGPRRPGERRRGGRRDRRAVDRRAGHAADDAHVPHRRRRVAGGGGVQRGAKSAARAASSPPMRYVTNGKGELVVISRSGEIMIHDEHGRERERHKVPYGATLEVKARPAIKAGTVLANWDAADPPDHHRVRRHGEVRERRGGRDGRQAGRRGHRPVDAGGHRSEAPRRSPRCVRPQVKLLDAQGNEVKIPGTDHSVTIAFQVGSLIKVRDGQDSGRRRGAGAHPGRGPEDPRHHGRPAARGGAVRSALAQGRGHAGRGYRHGVVRQGDQGQAAPADHRPRTASCTSSWSPRRRTSWCTKARW